MKRTAIAAILALAPGCASLQRTAARPETPACMAAVADLARSTYSAAVSCAPLATPEAAPPPSP